MAHLDKQHHKQAHKLSRASEIDSETQSDLQCKAARSGNLVAATAARRSAAATSFARLIAIPAEHRTVTTRFKRNRRGLSAPGTNYRGPLGRSRTITGASLFTLFCQPASFATLGGGKSTFLKERLIGGSKCEILPAIAARKLNISGHLEPPVNCTVIARLCK